MQWMRVPKRRKSTRVRATKVKYKGSPNLTSF